EFLRRYQPVTTTTESGAPGSDVSEMLQTGTVPITMNDLVNLMLDKNLDIQSNRFSPRSSYYSSIVFYRALQPSIRFSATGSRNTTQVTSQVTGVGQSFNSQLRHNFSAGFSQALPTGTSLSVDMTMIRSSTNSNVTTFNPSYVGVLTYTV